MSHLKQEPRFEEKFIAYVDILGWKSLVEASEAGTGIALERLLGELKKFGGSQEPDSQSSHFNVYSNRGLDFCVTQVSDCAVISSAISPRGLDAIISHCWFVALNFLASGIMCRGYITKGRIFHNQGQIIGTGYQQAYEKERGVKFFQQHADDLGTPFIEIDKSVCGYADKFGDAQTKSSFRRMVKRDGELAAVFPFELFQHSYTMGSGCPPFDAEREKLKNDQVRQSIRSLIVKVNVLLDRSNAKVVMKGEHYIRALTSQLEACDKMDADLDLMNTPIYLLRERNKQS